VTCFYHLRSSDPPLNQMECDHDYRSYCSLPLCIFEGTSHALGTAYLRPGVRPPGTEHAMLVARLLPSLRQRWPHTHSLVRGDSPCATPEIMDVMAPRRRTDCVFG
jgi:hypothetical protein